MPTVQQHTIVAPRDRRPHERAAAAARAAAAPAPEYAFTGAKLGWAVLAYVGCVVLVITLEPFAFAVPAAVHPHYWASDGPWGGWFDVVMNVAMFLPLGFLAALARSARGDAGGRGVAAWAAAAGAAASAAIELAQCFEPDRVPSPTDVAANAAGAWAGAWLCVRASAHLRADTPLVGRLALELPVTGLVYVTLPLLTLAGLTAGGGHAARALGLVALAAFGGVLVGTVQRRHLGPTGATRARTAAGVSALWFAAGAFPAVLTARSAYVAGVAVAAGAAWLLGRGATTGVRGIERRFETEALARGAPWLAAYLALVFLGDAAESWGKAAILRTLEHVAGFTVLGYLLAEAWGRREWRYRRSAWRIAAAGSGTAAALAVAAWAAGQPGAGAAGVAVRALAAAYGGWIYHLQRAHVRALVAARRPVRARAAAAAAPATARVA
jgi:hypothetical protein